MPSALEEISNELKSANINFLVVNDKIEIPLPNNFDILIIEIWNDADEDCISLKEGDFHTHGDIEARENGLPNRLKGIRFFVESIFNGSFKMVRYKKDGVNFENTIWDSISLSLVDEDDEYEIVSET